MTVLSVIVPFSRPKFFSNVIENFKRQNYIDKKLIVVENGLGIGHFKNSGCTVLSSDEHHAFAKNEAISWMKKNGGGWWVTMDDDDYYGPEYLTEVAQNIGKGDVLGKNGRFIADEERTLLLCSPENQQQQSVLGATLAARSEISCELKPVTHDDGLFTQDMRDLGCIIYATSKYNFVHRRYKNISTSWSIDIDVMAQIALDSGFDVLQWDGFPLDIINGKSDISGFNYVKTDYSVFINTIQQNNSFQEFIKNHDIILNDFEKKLLHNTASWEEISWKQHF
jgi:hypothetical protein